jgi:hypothetical protein
MRINFGRGTFRLWVLASALWCTLIILLGVDTRNVASPFAASPMVHVKFSNTETWDYPVEWGVERIGDDLKRRVQELNRKEQAWLATVSESRKAQCQAIPSIAPFSDQPADCVRMGWAAVAIWDVPSGWEPQVREAPISMWQAIAKLMPWAGGPPILVLGFGYALFWQTV